MHRNTLGDSKSILVLIRPPSALSSVVEVVGCDFQKQRLLAPFRDPSSANEATGLNVASTEITAISWNDFIMCNRMIFVLEILDQQG